MNKHGATFMAKYSPYSLDIRHPLHNTV